MRSASWMPATRLATDCGASAPLAWMESSSPWRTPSAMMATTLRAFAVRPWARSAAWAPNALPRCATSAAGRAGSPCRRARMSGGDVNAAVDALSGADRQGMCGRRQGDDLAGAGCDENSAGRVDGNPVAEHAARKHGVRYFVERAAPAIERRQDL